ncbi:hypothetical protein PsYK624_012800 [Phanerochaete sordida]|uniref:Uncharacterized protein n=1 Tax=Phanerochaete sordida TaxID=48140 RepID=A0A9P3FZ60_9APHY|nr:hypothetical protein PsYK624_012800 [Phanerochaete sordida]
MTRHAENLHLLVQQPASSRSADFKQKSIDEASGFLSSLRGFHGTLAQLSTDEGLANYDLGESLGTPLRNIAHGIKSVLTDFETLADDIPDIGPQSYTILTDGFGQVIVDIDYSLRKAESLLDNTSSGFVESIAMFDELLYGIAQSGSSVSCTTAGCFLVPYVAT